MDVMDLLLMRGNMREIESVDKQSEESIASGVGAVQSRRWELVGAY